MTKKSMEVLELQADLVHANDKLAEIARTVMSFQDSLAKKDKDVFDRDMTIQQLTVELEAVKDKWDSEVWARKCCNEGVRAVAIALRSTANEMCGKGKPGVPDSFIVALTDYLDLLTEED
jgi:chromosome segregation ATPase